MPTPRSTKSGTLLKHLPALGLQESRTQVRSGSTGKKDGRSVHFRIPHVHLPEETLRACETPAQLQRESCSGETTSKMAVGTEQFSRSKEHQLRKWQQQDSSTTFLDFFGMAGVASNAVSGSTQVHLSEASRVSRMLEKECPQVWIKLPPHRSHPVAGLLWERKLEEVHLEQNWEKVPTCECLYVHRKSQTILVRISHTWTT